MNRPAQEACRETAHTGIDLDSRRRDGNPGTLDVMASGMPAPYQSS